MACVSYVQVAVTSQAQYRFKSALWLEINSSKIQQQEAFLQYISCPEFYIIPENIVSVY